MFIFVKEYKFLKPFQGKQSIAERLKRTQLMNADESFSR